MSDIVKILREWDASGCIDSRCLHERNEAAEEIERLQAENERLIAFARDFQALVNESSGIDGLHLNGDKCSWEELLPGGWMEGWLGSFELVEPLLGNVATTDEEKQ